MTDELLPGITLFTPTYNRAHTLKRLYDSIVCQDTTSIEWLVVDDGSCDGTAELIKDLNQERKLDIHYVYKENGGKHTALNLGIQLAKYQYFLCVDSDDCLAEGAVEQISCCIRKDHPFGIIGYKASMGDNARIGDCFPEGLEKTTLFSLINTYHCSGDRTLIYQTAVLKNIHIPEPRGVDFFPETYIYDRFDEQHESVLLPVCLCRCEYLPGGYSDSFRMLMIRNALSMKWFYAQRIDMPCSFLVRMRSVFRYIAYSLLATGKEGKYSGRYRWLFPLGAPKGIAMYFVYEYYRRQYHRKQRK